MSQESTQGSAFAQSTNLADQERHNAIEAAKKADEQLKKERELEKLVTLWQEAESRIVAYLAGDSSRSMVEAIKVLAFSYDDSTDEHFEVFRDEATFPAFDQWEPQYHLEICKLITTIWLALRFDNAEPEVLENRLNAETTRKPIEDAMFVRYFVVRGGLPRCSQCGRPLRPTEIDVAQCEDCDLRDKETLAVLQIAIECEHRYGIGSTYSDGVAGHFPKWKELRNRLLDFVHKVDDTDHELWKVWTTHVRRQHGLSEEEFCRVPIDDAQKYLPGIQLTEPQELTPANNRYILAASCWLVFQSIETPKWERGEASKPLRKDAYPIARVNGYEEGQKSFLADVHEGMKPRFRPLAEKKSREVKIPEDMA